MPARRGRDALGAIRRTHDAHAASATIARSRVPRARTLEPRPWCTSARAPFDIEHAVTGASAATNLLPMNPSSAGRGLRDLVLPLAVIAAIGGGAFVLHRQEARLQELTATAAKNDAALQEILGEVTRVRLEQRNEALGVNGLLEKLRTYAPMLTSSRIPEPDYKYARAEMDAILRALAAIGKDAWGPVTERLRVVKADAEFDEARWLLRAATRVDPLPGKEIVKDVLAGKRLPSSRLRLDAARLMTEIDRPLAQAMLRQILLTESSRGVNLERASAQGYALPDPAALSASGFHNYVAQYVDSGDEQIDDTLLMVVGRAEHDIPTIQKCVEYLGKRKCERAVPTIEKLYAKPPFNQENPLFMNHCLTALNEIQGERARPFLEEALRKTTSDIVANHARTLLAVQSIARPDARAQDANSIAPPGKK